MAARLTAADLVGRIERQGAWSNVVTRDLDGPDAALIRHLTYGVTRHRERIDRSIAAVSSRPLAAITPSILDILRVGVHELLFSRTPDHAAVDTAVEAARTVGSGAVTGFVNAILRSIAAGGEPSPPTGLAEELGIPAWLIESLTRHWGSDAAERFARSSSDDAPLWVRMRDGSGSGVVPGTSQVDSVPDGGVVQDPASVAVAVAVQPESGDRVLEVGAAPGGKSLALYDLGARVAAVDAHRRRVERSARRLPDLQGAWTVADGRDLPFRTGTFDRVLLDAPCTGLGTLRRRPEIKYKATPAERDRLAHLQRQLLGSALTMVAAGGRLVYAVCTVTFEETEAVAGPHDGRPPTDLPGERLEHGLLMAPHSTGTDGMYISVIDA